MGALLSQRRFTVDEFHRMGEVGILDEDDRVELLDGRIIQMAAIGSRHAACVARLDRLFHLRLHDRALVWVQNPVRLDRYTQLVPDLALLRPRADFYADGCPRPGDILSLVEVCEATLVSDRQIKVPAYAGAGVPELWLVDLRDRCVEIHRQPAGEAGYDESATVSGDGSIESKTVPELSVTLDEILG